jgi:amino acid transporter
MFPKSAGEAAYAFEAFNNRSVSSLVGITVVLIGTVSAATMIKGFAGYFIVLLQVPEPIVIIGIIILITVFAIWGISQSLIIASCITIIEVLGLLFVIYAVIDLNELKNYSLPESNSILPNSTVILYAAFISFYAYIGFEDIVNIAEETINPTKIVPLAITLSLVFSTLLYIALSTSCTIFIPASVFNTSSAPLVSIVEYKGYNPLIIALVSMIAIINGALVQLIMASRVLYGMAEQKLFLPIFKSVNTKTHTPILATVTIAAILMILVTIFDLLTLAEFTSAITLIIFIVVQTSLLYLSIQKHSKNKFDFILPIFGITLNFILLIFGFS